MPLLLYIPHGSDERTHANRICAEARIFISHMVQMKVTVELDNEMPLHPLYPTWFRWKLSSFFSFSSICLLYIPHGSDERQTRGLCRQCEHSLYIPHGSDESCIICAKKFLMLSLYPTWFRWKSPVVTLKADAITTLYPTWFRWKENEVKRYDSIRYALYPTWFRWKQRAIQKAHRADPLYIPHGSDERRWFFYGYIVVK